MTSMTFDIDFDKFEAERGPVAPKDGPHIFRITRTSDLKPQSKGDNEGALSFSAWCEVVEDGQLTNSGLWEFIGFGKNRDRNGRSQIGKWKAFAEDIGRADILRADATPEELIETEFEATVKTSKRGNAFMVDVKSLEAAEEEDAEETEVDDDTVDDTPPPQAAKRKGRR